MDQLPVSVLKKIMGYVFTDSFNPLNAIRDIVSLSQVNMQLRRTARESIVCLFYEHFPKQYQIYTRLLRLTKPYNHLLHKYSIDLYIESAVAEWTMFKTIINMYKQGQVSLSTCIDQCSRYSVLTPLVIQRLIKEADVKGDGLVVIDRLFCYSVVHQDIRTVFWLISSPAFIESDIRLLEIESLMKSEDVVSILSKWIDTEQVDDDTVYMRIVQVLGYVGGMESVRLIEKGMRHTKKLVREMSRESGRRMIERGVVSIDNFSLIFRGQLRHCVERPKRVKSGNASVRLKRAIEELERSMEEVKTANDQIEEG